MTARRDREAARERDDLLGAERRALAAWRERDLARCIHTVDRRAVDTTEPARALVIERLSEGGLAPTAADARDLYNACARLGRLLFEVGASPSLAATTVDNAARALADASREPQTARVEAARSALAEGYAAALAESERARARLTWEYPACAVRLDATTLALAAGYPDEDGVADWAARVARAASKAGARRAYVTGNATARAELVDALELVGITVAAEADEKSHPPEAKRPWLRLPWARGARPK